MWNSRHFKLNMIMDYVTFIRKHRIHIQIKIVTLAPKSHPITDT